MRHNYLRCPTSNSGTLPVYYLLVLLRTAGCSVLNFYFDLQKNPTPNDTDSLPSLNISVETPKIDSTKYKSSSRDSSQDLLAQIVAMKAYFMNKVYKLKNEIRFLKNQ